MQIDAPAELEVKLLPDVFAVKGGFEVDGIRDGVGTSDTLKSSANFASAAAFHSRYFAPLFAAESENEEPLT
ncbi:MAG: hypothetical protein BHW65_01615 [Verrucomicrobia bacterium CAG:312_58_20]|nr:MAG: hypothetical protein BHW65_01615 [Verrucomicrobia bacterium CAG:312_58_20]